MKMLTTVTEIDGTTRTYTSANQADAERLVSVFVAEALSPSAAVRCTGGRMGDWKNVLMYHDSNLVASTIVTEPFRLADAR